MSLHSRVARLENRLRKHAHATVVNNLVDWMKRPSAPVKPKLAAAIRRFLDAPDDELE